MRGFSVVWQLVKDFCLPVLLCPYLFFFPFVFAPPSSPPVPVTFFLHSSPPLSTFHPRSLFLSFLWSPPVPNLLPSSPSFFILFPLSLYPITPLHPGSPSTTFPISSQHFLWLTKAGDLSQFDHQHCCPYTQPLPGTLPKAINTPCIYSHLWRTAAYDVATSPGLTGRPPVLSGCLEVLM